MNRATVHQKIKGLIAVVLWALTFNALAAEIDFTAKYDVWISPNQNHGAPPVAPPYAPYHDCLIVNHFDDDTWNLMLQRCPPAGPAWVRTGAVESFGGATCDRYLLGWYINSAAFPWADYDTVGGVMGSKESQHSWGFEGVRNPDCHL